MIIYNKLSGHYDTNNRVCLIQCNVTLLSIALLQFVKFDKILIFGHRTLSFVALPTIYCLKYIGMIHVSLFLILAAISFFVVVGHQTDERILVSAISQHSLDRTSWSDIPVGIMPRFDVEQEVIFHAPIPKMKSRIDVNADFKVSLAFDSHKFLIPWITVFDAAKKRTLRKLIVTFTKNEHDILSVDHTTECTMSCILFIFPCIIYFVNVFVTVDGAKMTSRIDPTHPSLHGFEIVYKWKNAEVEDPVFGLQVLCGTALIGFMIIFMYIISNAESEDTFVPSSSQVKTPVVSRN